MLSSTACWSGYPQSTYAHEMAAEQIPKMMRAVGVRKYCKPEGYEIMEVPVPQIKAPDEVLIRVHVAGIFFADAQLAAGTWKPMFETS